MANRSHHFKHITQPIKALAPKFAYFGLVGLAVGLMVFAKAETILVEKTRQVVTDAAAPILDMASRPVATARALVEEVGDLVDIRAQNARLAEDNARLLQWRSAAARLEVENERLRGLLKYKPGPEASFVSARVVADTGGTFAHSLILNAGAVDGIGKGQAVMSDDGLVGRMAGVGHRAARVLLITDLNSRIPVLIEPSHTRAILAGDNTARPRLIHLPPGAVASVGDRIVTSGHAGVFPPGLPVGVVVTTGGGASQVRPHAARDRLEYVRVVNYGLSGILKDVTEKTASGKKKRSAR